jgi:hypothetical protein
VKEEALLDGVILILTAERAGKRRREQWLRLV